MLWEVWNLAKQLRTRPSEVFRLSDEFEAYCFDRAVTTFGVSLENALSAAGQSAKDDKQAQRKRDTVLDRWLGRKRQFKDPTATTKPKVSKPDEAPVSSDSEGVVAL